MSSLSQRLLRWPFLCAWRAPSLVLTRSDARLFSFSSRCVFAASAALFAAAVAHWVFFFTVAVAASASCNVCAHAASPRSVSCVIGMVCGGTFFRLPRHRNCSSSICRRSPPVCSAQLLSATGRPACPVHTRHSPAPLQRRERCGRYGNGPNVHNSSTYGKVPSVRAFGRPGAFRERHGEHGALKRDVFHDHAAAVVGRARVMHQHGHDQHAIATLAVLNQDQRVLREVLVRSKRLAASSLGVQAVSQNSLHVSNSRAVKNELNHGPRRCRRRPSLGRSLACFAGFRSTV